MNRRAIQKFSRKWHRRLGSLVGIQLFFWTLGGFYFSWFHIDDVRGTTDRVPAEPVNVKSHSGFLPPDSILKNTSLTFVERIELATFRERPVYRLYQDNDRVEMFDARSGNKLSPISREMAIEIARADFRPRVPIKAVHWIEQKGGEYKGPIPAYRIDFDYWKGTRVYVHANSGRVTAHRNHIWRGFDFLWMLHILDFKERENFNNWILRILSLLGLITLASGYVLWAVTTPLFRRQKKNP
ncbi:MAG: PepSY domain-containing protein [Calditrichaeota bacterium]|nr:PepSY domain-containing protein [Calditrichota bacterium]